MKSVDITNSNEVFNVYAALCDLFLNELYNCCDNLGIECTNEFLSNSSLLEEFLNRDAKLKEAYANYLEINKELDLYSEAYNKGQVSSYSYPILEKV